MGALESGGEGGGSLGGFGSGFGYVAGGLAGFADVVELVVVFGIEGAGVLCEPSAGDVDEFVATEVEIERWLEGYFHGVERSTNLLLIFFDRLREFARRFVPCCGQLVVQALRIGVFAAGFQEFAVDVEVADGAGGAAEFAECLAEGLRLAVDGSVGGDGGKELERGLDAAGGGTEFVDGLGRWLLWACSRLTARRLGRL